MLLIHRLFRQSCLKSKVIRKRCEELVGEKIANGAFLNKVLLIGNVGRDPDVKTLPSGDKWAAFPMATNEYWTNKSSGERESKTQWHRVAVFNTHVADFCEKYVVKGVKIYVEGQLMNRTIKDIDGTEKIITEVVLPKYKGTLTLLSKPVRRDMDSFEHSDPLGGCLF